MAEETRNREVFKFFTGARRIPLMIGRMFAGEKLWGGPYKLTQAVAGGVAAVVLYGLYSLGIGHNGNILIDLFIGAAIVAGVIFAFGKLPSTKRNLLSMGTSIVTSLTAPPGGRYRGRRLTLARPGRRQPAGRRQQIKTIVQSPASTTEVAPVPAATLSRPMSAVDVLLAQTKAR
ncbi:hypothetical protein [Agromyces bauzanensis]